LFQFHPETYRDLTHWNAFLCLYPTSADDTYTDTEILNWLGDIQAAKNYSRNAQKTRAS
jgi:hypothetical protein